MGGSEFREQPGNDAGVVTIPGLLVLFDLVDENAKVDASIDFDNLAVGGQALDG